MGNTTRLIGALWDLFTPDIATGHPVYFCFSQDLAGEALKKIGVATGSPLSVIGNAATECFEISGRRVILKPDALVSREGGRSMAIVLVCQQVLAVETMIDDGQISKNAYFPRLRELMSSELPLVRQRPFSRSEFLQIWQTLEREIKSCPGSTGETVTFHFGRYTGSNATRGFPFSQALLSRADLTALREHADRAKLLSSPREDAWREIRRAHRYLTQRGKKLVLEGSLYQEILDQARHFLQHSAVTTIQIPRRASQTEPLELGIAVDPDDFFSERYFAFVQRKGSTTPILDPDRIREKLTEILPSNTYLFCSPGKTEDYWVCQDREAQVSAGQSFAVIARGHGMQRARAVLDGLSPPLPLPEERCRVVGESTDIRACRIELPLNSRLCLSFRSGRLVPNGSGRPAALAYEWLGGVCVDFRGRKYLREALPDRVRFGAEEFMMSDVIRVGDREISWISLGKHIDGLEIDAMLDLTYPNRKIAKLSIAVAPRVARERRGFLIKNDGIGSPSLHQLEVLSLALVGYSELGCSQYPASIAELASLGRDIRSHRRGRFSTGEQRILRDRVEASSAPSVLKGLILKFLTP